MARLRGNGDLDFSNEDWEPPTPRVKKNPLDVDDTPTDSGSVDADPGPVDTAPPPAALPPPIRPAAGGPAPGPNGTPNSAYQPPAGGVYEGKPGGDIYEGSTLDGGNEGQWKTLIKDGVNVGGGGGGNSDGGGALSSLLMGLLSGKSSDPNRDAMYSKLNGLIDKYGQPVDPNDPSISGVVDSYEGDVGRSTNRFKEFAAERAHAEGVPSGAFDSQVGNAIMSGGRAVGDLRSQMMRDEMLSRREALMQTMQQSQGMMNADQAANLQSRISAIDGMLKSRGMDIDQSLGESRLSLDKSLGEGRLSLDKMLGMSKIDLDRMLGTGRLDLDRTLGMGDLDLRKLLGEGQIGVGMAGVGAQNHATDTHDKEFYDDLGFRMASEGNNLDEILGKLLLGGS